MESNEKTGNVEASTSTGVRHDERESEGNDQQWEDIDGCCLLCRKAMEESKSCVVKLRGISNLIQASLKRKDDKHLQLKELSAITVHKTCQTIYTRESNIKIAVKELKEKWRANRKRRSDGREFDFSSNCFFCSHSCHHTRLLCKKVLQQSTIDNLIAQLEVYPKTEINKIILSRLEPLRSQEDEYYVDNTVGYHARCLSNFYLYSPSNVKGKPISEEMNDLLSFVINIIVENSDECQFSLKDILNKYKAINEHVEIPRLDRIEKQLKGHFGDEVVTYSSSNDRFICFKRTLGSYLDDSWYSNKKNNEKEEKLRLVEMAANIILQDIRSMKFDLNNYNSPSEFLNNVTADVPETLQLFLNTLIKTHKKIPKNGSWSKWDNKISTAAHILMSSVRPRSFCSPILLGLSSMIHSKFGARGLIDCLYNLGLCESYSETIRFENSVINDPEVFRIIGDAYLQFVYNNADHNTATIDGKNTFHCMGGIMCVTPRSSVELSQSIPRLKGTMPKPNTSSTFGFLPLTDFKNMKPFKLDSVIIRDWKEIESVDFSIKIEPIDVLYFFGKHAAAETTPNWHGFMNKFHTLSTDYSTRIIALPFINAPPSDHTTILTALIDARSRANTNNQKHCFVTFDLPLFMKSSAIIASIDSANDPYNLRSIISRLGGFHLLMSFNGGIGNIMNGSGLKEAFCTIYAELSADKALGGHAFSRSVRGHLLVQAALATIILKKIDFTEDEIAYLNEGLKKVREQHFKDYFTEPLMTQIKEKFIAATKKLESNGPTSTLWIQYFKLICFILRYIDAERSGNFNLHLETVLMMIPIFFSSGHHLYAKACLLYLQNMIKLKEQMDIVEYDKFCNQGFFTIRRSSRFWSGIWSDMTIEQVLMRAMKCTGGLTHGRGLTENVIAMWILSRVAVLEVSNAMEIFSNVKFTSSEQHVDNRVSRMIRDADDLSKLQQFFETYDPFPETDNLIGIYSGVVGDLSTVNCHKAFEIDKILMQQTSGKKFTEVKYKKSSKLVHLAAANSVMKNTADEEVYMSPLLIFQRISLNIKNEGDIKEYCSSYELSPVPLSLFNENGMRKTKKAAFFSNFNFTYEIEAANITYVVDGGYFLHNVVWQSNLIVEKIVQSYVSYAKKHYTSNSLFIFDGYPEDDTLSTKSVERSRRKSKNISREIAFDNNTKITVNQVQFLNNEKNKSRLINMICIALNESGFRTKIAVEDADRLIIVNAIENARLDSDATIVIVGQDTDLLVIFTQLAENINNIYFCRICKGSPNEFYNCDSFKYPHLKKIVAFLHAFCGCDTVSCFYNMGEKKLIDSIPHNTLLELSAVFYNSDASCEKISDNAFQLIRGMYSTKAEKILMEKSTSFTLNDLRYLHFNKAKIKSKFALEALPPTEGAAKQHAFRVFYQVQVWLGNENIQATDWGWQIKNNQLVPIGSKDPCIPKKLLDQISCSCSKKGCIDGSCTCKKHGLPCSNLCGNCREDSCYNLDASNKSIESESESECEDEDIDLVLDDMNDVAEEIDILTPARKKRKI